MKTSLAFVHGGGWVKKRGQTRPKARLFGAVAVIWLALAVTGLAAFALNGWEILALFAPVPASLMLAIHFFRSEPPCAHSGRIRNPGWEPRKLY